MDVSDTAVAELQEPQSEPRSDAPSNHGEAMELPAAESADPAPADVAAHVRDAIADARRQIDEIDARATERESAASARVVLLADAEARLQAMTDEAAKIRSEIAGARSTLIALSGSGREVQARERLAAIEQRAAELPGKLADAEATLATLQAEHAQADAAAQAEAMRDTAARADLVDLIGALEQRAHEARVALGQERFSVVSGALEALRAVADEAHAAAEQADAAVRAFRERIIDELGEYASLAELGPQLTAIAAEEPLRVEEALTGMRSALELWRTYAGRLEANMFNGVPLWSIFVGNSAAVAQALNGQSPAFWGERIRAIDEMLGSAHHQRTNGVVRRNP